MAKSKGFKDYLDVGAWGSKFLMNNLLFTFFLGFLTTVYISNAHLAERNVREIQTLRKELKEMRWYYMSLQSENMYNAKRSEVAERVRKTGLRPQTGALKRIQVSEGAYRIDD